MWTDKQQTLFHIAAKHAGWTPQHRYIAMRAAGCPLIKGTMGRGQATQTGVMRPSIKNPANTHEMFAAAMMLAESCAATRGASDFPSAGGGKSWAASAADTGTRLRHKAREIWAEAQARMPGRFFGGEDSLNAIVRDRVCKRDTDEYPDLFGHNPSTLDACDAAQLCRVIELLRNWVGRDFFRGGLTPRTFTIPGGVIAQVKAEAKRHVAARQVRVFHHGVDNSFTRPEVFS